ncbi:MAG TPA: hypothetical protein VFF66_02170 [Brevundimonas sp.]|nr:hypothetical protein [Brevundimonas sp.]
MRLVGTLATLLIIGGCAPVGAESTLDAGSSSRRCFAPGEARLIKLDPASGAYVRTRSGEALQLTGSAACLDVSDEPSIGIRAVGPANADLCLGDRAHLDIRSHASILRTCDVEVARVVPQSEIARLPDRQSP